MERIPSNIISSVLAHARPLLQNRANALVASFILLLAPLLRYAYLDYTAWYSLGPGGVPHNALGWLIQNAMRLISRETLSTTCYDDPGVIAQAGEYGNKAFLKKEDVPERDPPRPEVGSWIVPQRQRNQFPTGEMKEYIRSHIAALAAASPETLLSAPSKLELHADGLFLASSFTTTVKPVYPHTAARKVKGEIAHMHASDGSLHVSLAPKDAKLVIERGWGQRHALSGGVLHAGYTMVYAPRNEEERIVVENIVDAGARFMCRESGNKE